MSLTSQELAKLQYFKEQVIATANEKLNKLILFGSRSRSEGNESSDIDVLVLLDKHSSHMHKQILNIASRTTSK